MATIPKTGIQEVVVRNILNANGANTDDQWSNLCGAAGKANWRARYKPVPYNVNFCQDHDPSGANYLAGWWKAFIPGDSYKSGRCGVDFPVYTSTASLQGVTDPSTLWGHDYPTGGSAQPYRITDFAGYDPDARDIISHIGIAPSGDVSLNATGYQSLLLGIFNNNLNTSALDYSEIGFRSQYNLWLKDLYYGAIAIRTSGTYHGIYSLPYTMEELNNITEDEYYALDDHYATLHLNEGLFPIIGEYDIYPVLFTSAKTPAQTATAAIACEYIPLPIAPLRVNVINPLRWVTAVPISVVRNTSYSDAFGTALDVTIRLTNENLSYSYEFFSGTQTGVNYIEAGIARSYNFGDGEAGTYYYARQTQDFTLAAGATMDVVVTTSYTSTVPQSDGEALVGIKMRLQEETIISEGFPFLF